MTRSNYVQVVLIVLSTLIIIGALLLSFLMSTDDDRNVIEVRLGDGSTESVKFESLGLVPGEKCEYTISLKGNKAETYELKLDFVENEGKELKNFARVNISANGEAICDELLSDVFENDDIVLDVDFNQNKNTELKIVYYMPLDVGNEAKNAEAVFELQLTASNE